MDRQKTVNLERIHLDNEELAAKALRSKIRLREQRQATAHRTAYKEVLLTLKEIEELKKPLVDSKTIDQTSSYHIRLRLKEPSKQWRKVQQFYHRKSLPHIK